MQNNINIEAWFEQLKNSNKDTPHIVVGYGSLLSQKSRELYSNIKSLPLPVTVSGWERGWVTRSTEEEQTYVGAYQNSRSHFNGQVFCTDIDEQLLKREQDYRFSKIRLEQLAFLPVLSDSMLDMLSNCNVYVCETLELKLPSDEFPVNSSYIDTCLTGCFEVGGIEEVKRFVATTKHWPSEYKQNDRSKPKYPRAASVDKFESEIFDQLQLNSK
ncbi:hypothetical protein [Brumicola nitratireducens]|uniref:Gamma-glutamylcyclotransferase AIG2-like domain-containing protein n=1 Tax=Glaciecola nitratireducens (strain JCM 12485 / KCTC 12276 / FR1064) TaxID=1085623 RepID=G4QML8_GLANF|nr:hypothetical protein [Glaciecola nitratireducens]AEP30970.1 hypothetical protein GNIT_2873 [Glaciecola nitratireducens FR1064]